MPKEAEKPDCSLGRLAHAWTELDLFAVREQRVFQPRRRRKQIQSDVMPQQGTERCAQPCSRLTALSPDTECKSPETSSRLQEPW